MLTTAWSKIGLCLALALPAIIFRFTGFAPNPVVDLMVFGLAVVSASFLLAWAAEAAQKDISGALAIALLALIAVLPEYAVDLYYAFRSGSDPVFAPYAAANMTGSNRLLLGFGWALVVFVALWVAKRAAKREKGPAGITRVLVLDKGMRLDIGFLSVLAILAFGIPLLGSIPIWYGAVLILAFSFYLWRVSRVHQTQENELVGMAANIAALPRHRRRWMVTGLFIVAAAIILISAEPFAEALVSAGSTLGIDSFFLVQWLAPLASEAPEFIIAVMFALRGMGAAAIATLIASKVNQWSLLVGSLPIANVLGGGNTGGLPLDVRQIEEFTLTATQTVLGVAIIIGLRFHRWSALALAVLFGLQFFITDTSGRYVLSLVQLLAALPLFWIHRRDILPTLAAPFKRSVPTIKYREEKLIK